MARSRQAGRRNGSRTTPDPSRPRRSVGVQPGTIAVRLADGAEGIVLHQRLVPRPVPPGPDRNHGRRYLLKELFE